MDPSAADRRGSLPPQAQTSINTTAAIDNLENIAMSHLTL